MKRKFTVKPILASDSGVYYVLVSFGGEDGRYKRAFKVVDKASIALQLCPDTLLDATKANMTSGSECINGIYKSAYNELSWIAEEEGEELTRDYLGELLDDDPQAFFRPYLDYINIERISKSEYDSLDLDEDGWVEDEGVSEEDYFE